MFNIESAQPINWPHEELPVFRTCLRTKTVEPFVDLCIFTSSKKNTEQNSAARNDKTCRPDEKQRLRWLKRILGHRCFVDLHQCFDAQCRGSSLYHWSMFPSFWSCMRTLSSVMANRHETKGCPAKSVSKKVIGADNKTQLPSELIAPAVCAVLMLFSAYRFFPACFNIRGKVLIMCFNIKAINEKGNVRGVWDFGCRLVENAPSSVQTNWISLSMTEKKRWGFHAPSSICLGRHGDARAVFQCILCNSRFLGHDPTRLAVVDAATSCGHLDDLAREEWRCELSVWLL